MGIAKTCSVGAFGADIQVREHTGDPMDVAYRIYKAGWGRKGGIYRCLIMGGEGPVIEVGTGDNFASQGIDGYLVMTAPAPAKMLTFWELDYVLPNWYSIAESRRHL